MAKLRRVATPPATSARHHNTGDFESVELWRQRTAQTIHSIYLARIRCQFLVRLPLGLPRLPRDIHITTGQPPVFRLHGRLRQLETKTLESEDTVALMKSITPERCQRELQEMGSADFGFAYGEKARFRVSIFKQRGDIAMVLRQIPNEMLPPDILGVPDIFTKLVMRPRGLILVTGPTGSGKSTTLASLVNFINERVDHHIITIEDPIEFYHYHKKSTVNQREVGVDVPSFAEAIRRALRQDPDVILVGELRDLETIEAAISAAETGHIVFGTLHTNSAQGTINRIIDAFPGNLQDQIRTQLSTSLIGVLAKSVAVEWRRLSRWS